MEFVNWTLYDFSKQVGLALDFGVELDIKELLKFKGLIGLLLGLVGLRRFWFPALF